MTSERVARQDHPNAETRTTPTSSVTVSALFDVVARRDAYGRQTVFVPAHEVPIDDEFWAATVRGAIEALAETHSVFTVDDLRADGLVPDPLSPASWGAAVSAAANAGLITCVGYRRSRRKDAHSRIVSVWTKADR